MSAQVFRLPDLGEGLTEAEIIEWQVGPGDEVTVDQTVVVVETAKATVEVPCPYAGQVLTLHPETGQSLEVGQPLITVGSPSAAGEPGPDGSPTGHEQYREEERAGTSSGSGSVLVGYGTGHGQRRRRRRTVAATPAADGAGRPSSTGEQRGGQAIRVISPLVRRLAAVHRVDLATLQPSRTDGILRRADVEAAVSSREPAAASAGAPRGEVRVSLTGVRGTIADKLTRSRREIPDATTWVDVDATELMATKDAIAAALPDAGIGVLALLARMALAGLDRYPELNASVGTDAGEIVQHGHVNLGFAAQSPRGLVVPVVRGAHTLSTTELARELRALTDAAREGSLSPAQLTGGTFTLNNYGVFGVDGSTPIINHPEAAMLGVGRIVDKPWAHQGALELRKVTQLSFTFDHRVCDGGTAGGYLRFVADCVQNPAVLLAGL